VDSKVSCIAAFNHKGIAKLGGYGRKRGDPLPGIIIFGTGLMKRPKILDAREDLKIGEGLGETMMKKYVVLALLSSAGFCYAQQEEKPKSPHTFTGNISLVSDYRFRGISQTMRKPAIQGGFDYAHASGIYVGTWASNVDGTTHFYNNTSMEWDFYGGYKGKLFPCSAPDFGYNLGLIYYYYPGGKAHNSHNTRYNTAEFYLELSYKWLSIKYFQTITNYFGINSHNTPFNWDKKRADPSHGSSRGSNYIEANATFDLIDKVCFHYFEAGKLKLLLHIGHQTVRHYGHLSYTDWRATLTQEFAWFNAFISYVGTNAKHNYYDVPDHAFHPRKHALGAQGVVLGVTKTF
jgi:uncharacterized protein (TIGR02001 family)